MSSDSVQKADICLRNRDASDRMQDARKSLQVPGMSRRSDKGAARHPTGCRMQEEAWVFPGCPVGRIRAKPVIRQGVCCRMRDLIRPASSGQVCAKPRALKGPESGRSRGNSLQFNSRSGIKRALFFSDFHLLAPRSKKGSKRDRKGTGKGSKRDRKVRNYEAIQCPEYAWLPAKDP